MVKGHKEEGLGSNGFINVLGSLCSYIFFNMTSVIWATVNIVGKVPSK